MNEHYDVVIVGSGFGGSVMAMRLAEKGKRVCVLERGKAYPPGSFPRTPDKMGRNFWSPKHGLHGMFDVWSFRHMGALVSSGLGGGSLIYANVLIRKDEKWFVTKQALPSGGYEEWPVTRADLEEPYRRAERMLCAQHYPFDVADPYRNTAKTRALKLAAETLISSGNYKPKEIQWMLPLLAVSFGNPGETPSPGVPLRESLPNLHGRPRSTCRLCGECDIGCNYGSKNTLDYTYLSAAVREKTPATIRTSCEVKELKPRSVGQGYEVSFVDHAKEYPSATPAKRQTLTCDRLVLAAGAVGTPYLLLKNRAHFPRISEMLGQRFSGNGDILTVARRCTESSGGQSVPRPIEPSQGPVITSAVRVADALDDPSVDGRGFYVEDAGFPAFVQWMMTEANAPSDVSRAVSFLGDWLGAHFGRDHHSNLSREFAKLIGDGTEPATMMPMLGMGRDIPNGTMSLTQEGDLDVSWDIDESKDYFNRVRSVMREMAGAVGGEMVDDPLWYINRSITVHPLGGCSMGFSKTTGVVNSRGEVFDYPGLTIADGSVMPGPVGPNPSLTIAALAERFAERIP